MNNPGATRRGDAGAYLDVIASASKAIQSDSRKKLWIASAYAQGRFGGLLPSEARLSSEDGSSLTLLAMTGVAV